MSTDTQLEWVDKTETYSIAWPYEVRQHHVRWLAQYDDGAFIRGDDGPYHPTREAAKEACAIHARNNLKSQE